MPEPTSHWTDDDDLLARFVLNRVEAAERERLEAHLRTCDQCRRAVNAEQLLAAGIKKAGREELKARLRERVVPRKRLEATWYQVAGVAAAIVVLVSIGVYNRWFIPSEGKQEPVAVQHEVNKVETPTDRSQPVEKDREKGPTPATGAGTVRSRRAEKETAAVTPRAPVESKSRRATEREIAPLQIAAAQAGKEGEVLSKGAIEDTTVWAQGVVLSPDSEDRAAPRFSIPLRDKKSDELRAQKMEAKTLTAPQRRDQAGVVETEGIVIGQRSLSDLPVSHRASRQETDKIETMFQRTGGKMHVIVYLDTLVTEPELQNARLVPVGEDSIILNLGGQRIGYKLPPGWRPVPISQTGKEQ